MDRADLVAAALPTQLEETGKCGIARRKWLLRGFCQKVARHSRSREAPDHQIAEAKASGIMCRGTTMGPQPPSSSKTNYLIFAQLSRIARARLAGREALTGRAERADECYASLAYCRRVLRS